MKNSWALVANTKCTHGGLALEYVPTKQDKPIPVKMKDVKEGLEKWKNTIVGFTLGFSLPYIVIKKLVETRWKEMG